MRCAQIVPYLPGYAGGDLRPDTVRLVGEHLAGCSSCRADARGLERVSRGLRALSERAVEPPPYLLDAVLESVGERKRRLMPPIIVPSVPGDLVRVLQDNRDAIAQAGATALVAAGAAYALWRAVRGRRSAQPATS